MIFKDRITNNSETSLIQKVFEAYHFPLNLMGLSFLSTDLTGPLFNFRIDGVGFRRFSSQIYLVRMGGRRNGSV